MSRKTRQPFTIEHILLGLVRQQPLHGYEIYQRLKDHELIGMIWHVKQSQVYALLSKLEQAGYLASNIQSQEAYPPRKVLRLTDEGAAAFATWISSPVPHWDDIQREFLAKLLFAQIVGDDTARDLIEQQRTTSTAWLDDLEQRIQSLQPCQSSEWLLLQFHLRQIAGFLEWLERCEMHFRSPLTVFHTIAAIKTSAYPELAHHFVEYICSTAGQTILEQHGFLPTSDTASSDITPAQTALATPRRFSPDQPLTVFAAAAFKDVFQVIAEAFSTASGGMTINLTFAGSQYLANEIIQGVPADVFASANRVQMELLTAAGLVDAGQERIFARNRLVLVTPKTCPSHLSSLRDLARPGMKLAFGSESTAIGHCSLDVLEKAEQTGTLGPEEHAAVLDNVAFYERDVRAVLDRVARGEADAAIVYTTDCQNTAEIQDKMMVHPFLV